MDTVSHYQQQFDRRQPLLPAGEPDWLLRSRREAMAHFVQSGFPKPREERWKYTRTTRIERHAYEPSAGVRSLAPEALRDLGLGLDAQRMVFVNGRFSAEQSRLDAPGAGCTVLPLADALAEQPQRLEGLLNGIANPTAHAFTALNTALGSDGAFIELAAGARMAAPLLLLFVTDASSEHIAQPRIVLRMGEGSCMDLVQRFVSHGAGSGDSGSAQAPEVAYFNNVISELSLGAGSRLTHYLLQQESTQANYVHTVAVEQRADSDYTLHAASLGAALARYDIDIALREAGASCTLNGLYFVGGRQHVDFHTSIDHAVADCRSREDFKGILMGHAHGVFNGRVLVRADAQRTDSGMSNHNLLLSENAEIDTKPELEIYADDVKCSHGATIGQLDESMLFYLRSRGIPAPMARAMLTHGFGQDIIERMELAPIKAFIADTLLDSLPHANELRSIMS